MTDMLDVGSKHGAGREQAGSRQGAGREQAGSMQGAGSKEGAGMEQAWSRQWAMGNDGTCMYQPGHFSSGYLDCDHCRTDNSY